LSYESLKDSQKKNYTHLSRKMVAAKNNKFGKGGLAAHVWGTRGRNRGGR